MTATTYRFDDTMQMSKGVAESADVRGILCANIPGIVNVHPAHVTNDKNGTDWWAEHCCGKMLSVDAKIRSKDFGKNDLALETWSNMERHVPGWTLRDDKRTDYILWLWKDTRRWCLLPFPFLCAAFKKHKDFWIAQYGTSNQFTSDATPPFHSQCIFVPIREIWAAIYRMYAGYNHNAQSGEYPIPHFSATTTQPGALIS